MSDSQSTTSDVLAGVPDPALPEPAGPDAGRTDPAEAVRRARHAAIRAEIADEESEAVEAEVAANTAALDVALHLRIDRDLDGRLRSSAAAAQIPTSALVRRLLRDAVRAAPPFVLTQTDVETIARRVAREELDRS